MSRGGGLVATLLITPADEAARGEGESLEKLED
jgi:hypothetical protein